MLTELIVNLHMHTYYSDGHGTHQDLVNAAFKAGVDAIIVTDHNVWVNGPEDYYLRDGRRLLMMVGEEVHDQARDPQKNHLLVFGAGREMATLASDPQRLIQGVIQAGGVCFLAHPYDPAAPLVGETDITWEDWQVQGYTGIELWNALSEFKLYLKTKAHAVYYAYQPNKVARGPQPETIKKWDELTAAGKRVVAIGGSDAHSLPASMGPLKRTLFPYEFHFRGVNTHVLLDNAPSGDAGADSRLVYEAMRQGHVFVGYDLPAPTKGFRFSAQGKEQTALMGDEISAVNGVTLQIRLPQRAECILLKDGAPLKSWTNRDNPTHITTEPGVYRVEVYLPFAGARRGWIFSNPIYVRA